MVCKSCVEKLKKRLMKHFGLSEKEAYERAYKAMVRVEKRIFKDRIEFAYNLRTDIIELLGETKNIKRYFQEHSDIRIEDHKIDIIFKGITLEQFDKIVGYLKTHFRGGDASGLLVLYTILNGIRLNLVTDIPYSKRDQITGKNFEYRKVFNITRKVYEDTWLHNLNADYSQDCEATGTCSCKQGTSCTDSSECYQIDTCDGQCPDPLPNSHYVSGTCSGYADGCICNIRIGECGGTCTCKASGGPCYYDCDDGYVWDPDTQQCKPSVITNTLTLKFNTKKLKIVELGLSYKLNSLIMRTLRSSYNIAPGQFKDIFSRMFLPSISIGSIWVQPSTALLDTVSTVNIFADFVDVEQNGTSFDVYFILYNDYSGFESSEYQASISTIGGGTYECSFALDLTGYDIGYYDIKMKVVKYIV